MTEVRLDTTRSYGIVVGDPKIAFEQDGTHFGFDKKPISQWAKPEDLANERAVRQKQKAKEFKLAAIRAARERKRMAKENDTEED